MNVFSVQALKRWAEPRDLFEEFARKPYCAWLDTPPNVSGQSLSRFSILAAEPFQVFRCKGQHIEIISPSGTIRLSGNPFDVLREQLALYRHDANYLTDGGFPVGAAIGFFGYGLRKFTETLPRRFRGLPINTVDDLGLPDCWFGFYANLLVFDHVQRKVWEVRGSSFDALSSVPDRRWIPEARSTKSLEETELRSNFTRVAYCDAVCRAKEYIAEGDIYQVNLSQRFRCDVDVAPTNLYLILRETNPAPYCAYLDIGNAQILSSSPECFLKIHDRHVITRPIKGTRPRGSTPERDLRNSQELVASAKDNAELLMITDLERNDLGKVSQFGSVRVRELVRVEPYQTVWHLVSTVEGLLRREVSHIDCVRACFPGGSVTGAPKIRAMQIIEELEALERGVYTGSVGYLGFNGTTHLNIAIRTVVCQPPALTFHSGGGIVADSDPAAEYEETIAKAEGIHRAIRKIRIRQRSVCN